MVQGTKYGKLRFLRTARRETYGPPGDAILGEVLVGLDTEPEMGFVLDLSYTNPNLIPNLAMLSLLKEAYLQKLTIGITYLSDPGKKNVYIYRVETQIGWQKQSPMEESEDIIHGDIQETS